MTAWRKDRTHAPDLLFLVRLSLDRILDLPALPPQNPRIPLSIANGIFCAWAFPLVISLL